MKTTNTSKFFLIFLVVAISAVFLNMTRPFLMAILLAGIFTSLSQPLFQRLVKVFRGRKTPAALLTLVILVLVIIIPLGFLTGVVTNQALKVGESVSPWVQDKVQNPDKIVIWMEGLPFYDRIAPYQDDIMNTTGQAVGLVSQFLISSLSSATSGTLNFLFLLSLMLYAMYFFLVDGDKLLDLILYYLPLEDKDERRLLDKFRSVTRATLKGTAVIGVLQGSLAGLAFAVVGIPSAIFWGTLMTVLSIVPGIGTALIWVPAAILLMTEGNWGKGIGLAIFCGLIVGSIDNFLRPRLVGKDTQMPDLLILLGTMGGILMFGILGFIIGPIVAALFVTIWDIYGKAFADVLPPARQANTTQDSTTKASTTPENE